MLSCFSYVWLCNCSLPSCSVHRIFQAWILEWVAMLSPPGHLPNVGIEPASLISPVLAVRFFTTSATWEGLDTILDFLFIDSVWKRYYKLFVVSSGGGKKWFYREGFQRWWWEKYCFPFFPPTKSSSFSKQFMYINSGNDPTHHSGS